MSNNIVHILIHYQISYNGETVVDVIYLHFRRALDIVKHDKLIYVVRRQTGIGNDHCNGLNIGLGSGIIQDQENLMHREVQKNLTRKEKTDASETLGQLATNARENKRSEAEEEASTGGVL